MTQNEIHQLLDEVARTGTMPSEQTIRESVTKFSSVAQRTEIAQRVHRACRSIINALDSNLADAAYEHAADVAEALSEYTSAGASTTPRELAAEIPRAAAMVSRPRTASQSASEPLRTLLRGATQQSLRARDLDSLNLRSGLSAEERVQWRAQVVDAANKIARHFATGNQGEARAMADEAAARLGADLAEPVHVDPLADEDDPRALAAGVSRQR